MLGEGEMDRSRNSFKPMLASIRTDVLDGGNEERSGGKGVFRVVPGPKMPSVQIQHWHEC